MDTSDEGEATTPDEVTRADAVVVTPGPTGRCWSRDRSR